MRELIEALKALAIMKALRQPKGSKKSQGKAEGALIGKQKVGRAPKGWPTSWAAPPTKYAARYNPKMSGASTCGKCRHFDDGHCDAVQNGRGEHAEVLDEGGCVLWMEKKGQQSKARGKTGRSRRLMRRIS